MNMSTSRKEDRYYFEKSRTGTSSIYKQVILNIGSLTFPIYLFKDAVYKEHKTSNKDFRKSSKIPAVLFSRYKFGVLKKIN